MAGLQGREKRQPANQAQPEAKIDWLQVLKLDETRGVLLSGKGSSERRQFLEWAVDDLSRASGKLLSEENVAFLAEFLPYALEDSKRSDVVESSCRVSLLAYLWLLEEDSSDKLRSVTREPLHKILTQSHPVSTRLAALTTLVLQLTLSPQPSQKEIVDLLEKVILPPIEKAGKVLLDGEDVGGEDEGSQQLETLIVLMASLLGFIPTSKLHEILDWCFDALVVLLEQHQKIEVKVAAAEAAVAALDLVNRHDELEWDRIDSKELISTLHGVLRDEDWGSDEERHQFKHVIEELVSMVDSEDYIVEIPFISAKGQSYVMSRETLRANKGLLFKHRNKKGNAVSGWSDAICVQFIRDTLGYTFSEMSNIGEVLEKVSDDERSQSGFSKSLLYVLCRHPAAEEFGHHVTSLKSFGSSTRMSNSTSYDGPRGKKKDLVRSELA